METLPLSAEIIWKKRAFERTVEEALRDQNFSHDETVRIVAAARAGLEESCLLAEGVDIIGSIARGTRGMDSPRVQRRLNERRRRGGMATLAPHHPDRGSQAA